MRELHERLDDPRPRLQAIRRDPALGRNAGGDRAMLRNFGARQSQVIVTLGVLAATIVLIPPLLLACFRLGMSENVDQLVANLDVLPKTFAIGLLGTLAYTAIPLAVSSLVTKRAYALAVWSAYYIVVGNMAFAVSHATSPRVAALDIPTSMQTVSSSCSTSNRCFAVSVASH